MLNEVRFILIDDDDDDDDFSLVNLLHGLLNCEIGGLDCLVNTTEYRTCVHCIHM